MENYKLQKYKTKLQQTTNLNKKLFYKKKIEQYGGGTLDNDIATLNNAIQALGSGEPVGIPGASELVDKINELTNQIQNLNGEYIKARITLIKMVQQIKEKKLDSVLNETDKKSIEDARSLLSNVTPVVPNAVNLLTSYITANDEEKQNIKRDIIKIINEMTDETSKNMFIEQAIDFTAELPEDQKIKRDVFTQ